MGKTLLLTILALILITWQSFAGNIYYVSNSGNDSATGTETEPWANCPGMNEWTGTITLHAGDTVYFINTGTWVGTGEESVLNVSGGITYDGSSWGLGSRAKLMSSVSILGERGIITINDDHPTIETIVKGFEIDGKTGDCNGIRFMPNNWRQHHLIGATKRVDDCLIYDCGSIETIGQKWSYGICVTAIWNGEFKQPRTLSNVELINCTVYRSSRGGIVVYPSASHPENKISNVIIRDCEIYDSGWNNQTSAGVGIASKNWVENILIEYNYIHDGGGNDDWGGSGMLFDNSTITNPLGTFEGIVRYNIISNNKRYGIQCSKSGASDVAFYGNIIANNGESGVSINMNDHQNMKLRFYNNTFYKNGQNQDNWYGGEISFSAGSYTFSVLEIVNNIFYLDPPASNAHSAWVYYNEVSNIIPTRLSNNIYYKVNGGNLVKNVSDYYNSDNIDQWESSAYFTEPTFKDILNLPNGFNGVYGVDLIPNADGLSIETGIGVDNGVDLGGFYNGAINLSGSGNYKRPVGNSWDIGAYEYNDGNVPENEITEDIYILHDIFPNPMINVAIIPLDVLETAYFKLDVMNIHGQHIRNIQNGELTPGEYEFEWDGKNANGSKAATGTYFVTIQINDVRKLGKTVMIK